MNEIVLLRHYATRGNGSSRYIGRTDEPIIDISGLAAPETEVPDGILFVSPMLRCLQTAERLFPGRQRTVIHALRECDFGIFEGKTADELSDCAEYSAWLRSDCLADIPGGESVTAFKERCCRAFLDIAEFPGERAVIVTHGGVIMAILERFGYPKRSFYEYYVKNGEWLRRSYANGMLIE